MYTVLITESSWRCILHSTGLGGMMPPCPTGEAGIWSCKGRSNGDYQSCFTCNHYVTCDNGKMVGGQRACPDPMKLLWDDREKQCSYMTETCKQWSWVLAVIVRYNKRCRHLVGSRTVQQNRIQSKITVAIGGSPHWVIHEVSNLSRNYRAHFKVSNVNKIAIFLRNRINSTCMLFLVVYTFVIVTMRLCGQRNTSPK